MKTFNKYIYVFIFSLLSSACIERYFIDNEDILIPKIVIEGTITDLCEPQEVVISHSSSTDWAKFHPLSDCVVQVIDKQDMIFEFTEDDTRKGHYFCNIDEQYLFIGNRFQLNIKTPSNQIYVSSFEEMLPCPPIDTLYYKIEHRPTSDRYKFIDGIQFYTDFKASDYFGHYYRWVLEECYEYHSFWPIRDYIDENNAFVKGWWDYSLMVCYKTNTTDDMLTLSTNSFTENKFNGIKLNFVDDHTQRLLYNYRLDVKQLSLDEKAFNYWSKVKKNNKSDAGLFTQQPSIISSNISSISDSTEIVLGYFGVSSVTTKQLVVGNVEELSFKDMFRCTPAFFKYTKTPWEPRPLYTFWATDPADNEWSLAWAPPECFDCTLLGGVIEKPDFFE